VKKWPIALQVYSVRDDIVADFEGTMRKIKAMGYDGVELSGVCKMAPAEQKKVLDDLNLQMAGAHVSFVDIEKDSVLSAWAAVGAKYIVIPHLKAPENEEELAAVIDRIRNAAERCRAYGMKLLYHNHDFDFRKIADKYILEHYYDEIPAELLETELDVCWVYAGGESPAPYVRKYSGRAPVLHLKDFAGRWVNHLYQKPETPVDPSEVFQYRPVGYGRQDMPALIEAAEDAGCQWLVVEQDFPSMGRTAMECAEMSIRYLKSFL
jgi:sugar phosphate isomerase/epimerase